ncbi:NRDE family protein [Nocardia callitridis]|uniref:NRDE family protein n=1 Tax=Nocardia callitridis TaxID=648753 RepID=A0ABP9JY96_9NOCA
MLIGWRAHPKYRLIVAANRDEYYVRPAEPMRRWPEVPGLIAGRDVGAKNKAVGDPPGTWLGLTAEPNGHNRFAAVTNVRNPSDERAQARSRGALLMDFLGGGGDDPTQFNKKRCDPTEYVRSVASAPDDYNGYNLVVGDMASLWWHSNRGEATPQRLVPGFHGLSNAAFVSSVGVDPPGAELTAPQPVWPKVRAGVLGLRAVVESDADAVDRYFEVLADRTKAPDRLLPHTGVSHAMERALSSRFIAHSVHGTRASTVLLVGEDGSFEITERSFGRLGRLTGTVSLHGPSGTMALPDVA